MLINPRQVPPRQVPPRQVPLAPGIPRVLHQIWIGGAPMPARWEGFAARLRALHPAWEYRLWGDAEAAALLASGPDWARALYAAWDNFGYRSDLLRLLILSEFGGVYLDTDCEPVRPLDPLLEGRDAFLGATFSPQPIREVLVENAVIAAAPGHPFVALALARIREACALVSPGDFAAGRPNIVFLTGPARLSRVLMEWRAAEPSVASDLSALPARALYPVVPGGLAQNQERPPATPEEFPGAYLVHWWDGSWVRQQEAQRQGHGVRPDARPVAPLYPYGGR